MVRTTAEPYCDDWDGWGGDPENWAGPAGEAVVPAAAAATSVVVRPDAMGGHRPQANHDNLPHANRDSSGLRPHTIIDLRTMAKNGARRKSMMGPPDIANRMMGHIHDAILGPGRLPGRGP